MPANPTALKKVKEIARKDILLSVARVPKTGRLYAGSSDFKVYEFDVAAAKPEVGEFAGHQSYVTGVALAGDALVSGGYDQKLIWWDREKRTPIRTVENAHAKWIRAVVASPDGSLIASVGDDMVCRVWDAKSGGKALRAARPRGEDADALPVDVVHLLLQRRRQAAGDRGQGRPRSSSGTWPPASR